jgi:hypothetical protein
MKLGVVVLNWNGGDVTARCLESLRASACAADQIVVVDNASTDGSADLVRGRHPQVVLLANDSNLGFAEGNNVGIRYLLDRGFDLILLLNNETVVDAACLCELRRAAQTHPAAAYGATIYEQAPPGKLWYAGGSIHRLTLDARHDITLASATLAPRPTGFITGCCLMLRADALRRVGLLDADFFAYYEDVDWCLRARAAGEQLVHVPAAIVHHEVSYSFRRAGTHDETASRHRWAQSRPLVLYLAYRNRLLLARRHAGGPVHRGLLVLRRLSRAGLHAALLLLAGRGRPARALVEGTMDGLHGSARRARVERYLAVAATRSR